MKTNYINPFPLPNSVSKEKDVEIATLVNLIVAEKENQASAEKIENLEKKINAAVYSVYSLSDTEIETIERAI